MELEHEDVSVSDFSKSECFKYDKKVELPGIIIETAIANTFDLVISKLYWPVQTFNKIRFIKHQLNSSLTQQMKVPN